MTHPFEAFKARREACNEQLLKGESLALKRFMAQDKQVYGEGAPARPMKEPLGLVASMVLRCNDCIDYQCIQNDCLNQLDSRRPWQGVGASE